LKPPLGSRDRRVAGWRIYGSIARLGDGMKYVTGFGFSHLGRIGKMRPTLNQICV